MHIAPADLARHVRADVWLTPRAGHNAADDFAVYGFTCPPSRTNVVVDQHCVIAYVGGRAEVHRSLTGRELAGRVEPGCISIKDARSSGEWRWDGDALDAIHVYLRPAMLQRVAQEVFGVRVQNFHLRDALAQRDEEVWELVQAIGREAQAAQAGAQVMSELMARQLSVLLLRRHAEGVAERRASFSDTFDERQRRRILAFISARLDGDLSVEQLAREEGMGQERYARFFRNTFGCGPHQRVIQMRVERALELLSDRRLSIADIAFSTGFADQSHLNRCFKQRFGMPPGRWRDQGAGSC